MEVEKICIKSIFFAFEKCEFWFRNRRCISFDSTSKDHLENCQSPNHDCRKKAMKNKRRVWDVCEPYDCCEQCTVNALAAMMPFFWNRNRACTSRGAAWFGLIYESLNRSYYTHTIWNARAYYWGAQCVLFSRWTCISKSERCGMWKASISMERWRKRIENANSRKDKIRFKCEFLCDSIFYRKIWPKKCWYWSTNTGIIPDGDGY